MPSFKFDSLEAFLDATTREYGDADGFYDNVSLAKAKDLARLGWPDGLKQIEKFAGKLEQVTSKFIARQDMIYDVAGLDFDITSVVNGEPECWYDFSPKEEQKVVSILYGIGVSGGMSKETMQIRGAAICSLVDLLESNNIRVELDIFFDFNYGKRGIDRDVLTTIRIKDAGQQLDLDRVAFCLMHAGMARKLSFSFCKSQFSDRKYSYEEQIGWGTTLPDETGYNLVIRRGHSDFPEYASIASTITWIKKTLKDFGVHIEV